MNKANPGANILGVDVSALTYAQTLGCIARYIRKRERGYICVCAVHLIMECQNNDGLRRGVNRATLVTPDGMPLVWLLRQKRLETERVYGPDLMLEVCKQSAKRGWSVFLLGGSEGQSEILRTKLLQKFPSLHIVGAIDTTHLPLSYGENQKIIRAINKSSPNIVFVGMGCPLQELWMIENRSILRSNILIGVGAAFNFISEKTKQAPHWMRQVGLEWLFRVLHEPKRLWRRYSIQNIKFVYLTIRQLIKFFLHHIRKD